MDGGRLILAVIPPVVTGGPSRWVIPPHADSPEQLVKIIALACEHPQDSGRPLTQWTSRDLADELVQRGIVTAISRATVSRLLQEIKIKPHRSRYWLNAQPPDEAQFDEQVRRLCALYRQAAPLQARGIHVVCVDEKTGIQALGVCLTYRLTI